MKIERMGPEDQQRVMTAGNLFDYPPRSDAVNRFLADPNHHLLIAYSGDVPAGFVSGVEVTHPDKGTEMFLYELAVDEAHRRQGIGAALVEALRDLARERGCYGMWVLTDDDNAAAGATYRKAGGEVESQPLMFSWRFVA
jgi:ribosomal protein S18 acetylase RimI-like enzyme